MQKFVKNKINVLLSLLIFILTKKDMKNYFYTGETYSLTLIINMKNLTKEKSIFFKKIIKELNSTRNYYFVKTERKLLIENLNKFVENDSIKIVQSNFPDSIYLPLAVSIFGNDIPDIILFLEGEDLINYNGNALKRWYNYSLGLIMNDNYDYIFGNSQIIEGKKIGCSLLLSKASIVQHLLYYTDCDTTHTNPLIQFSLANNTKFDFISFPHIKKSEIENINNKFSRNINCPSIKDNLTPSLCIILPAFKREYFSFSFPSFSNQTYKPKFYVFMQNDNRKNFNLTFFENLVNEPIYHIWMQNFNSFFF